MKPISKKGQAAMEFLMTYGWAILVVLAAIGALAYFGVLDMTSVMPTRCTIGQGFTCVEHKINDGGPVQLRIRNSLGELGNASVTLSGIDTCSSGETKSFGTVNNGEDLGGAVLSFGNCTPSDRFSGTINVTYTEASDTLSHTTTGSLVGQVE